MVPPPPPVPPLPPPPSRHDAANLPYTNNAPMGQQSKRGLSSVPATPSHGLVPSICDAIDAERAREPAVSTTTDPSLDLEFATVTPGMVADLVFIQRKTLQPEPYTPLDPHRLPQDARGPIVEPGRLEAKMAKLRDDLRKQKGRS